MYKQQTKPENLPATEHQPPEAIIEKSGATADTPVPGEEEVSTQQSPTEEKGNSDAAPQSNTPTLVTASPRPFEVRRSPLFKITRLLLAILAGLLIISGFTFILYATSAQYQGSLHIFGTVQAQSTQRVVNATQRAVQGTASALGTTQANINATATAMGNNAAMATASSEAATATASAFSDMLTRATSGKPVLDDPLSDNSGPGKWDEGSPSTNTGCTFQGLYNVQEATQGYLQPCIAEASNFSDFSYQISLSITQGYQGRAGLLFHVDSSKKAFYFFHIGTDNTYALDLYQGTGKVDTLSRGLSYTISAGLNQSNQLAVIAHDTTYDLFINGGYVASVTDGTLGAGKVGVAVIDNGTPVTAQFSDAKVWQGRS